MRAQSITFIVTIVFAFVFAWFVMLPAVRDIDETQKTIEQTRQDIALLESTQGDIDEAITFFETIDEETQEKMALALPEFSDRVNLTIVLNRLAQDNGLTVSNIAASRGDSSDTGAGRVQASLSLEGTYAALKSFIASAERTLRIVDIRTISARREDPENPLRFDITADAFFLNEGAASSAQ